MILNTVKLLINLYCTSSQRRRVAGGLEGYARLPQPSVWGAQDKQMAVSCYCLNFVIPLLMAAEAPRTIRIAGRNLYGNAKHSLSQRAHPSLETNAAITPAVAFFIFIHFFLLCVVNLSLGRKEATVPLLQTAWRFLSRDTFRGYLCAILSYKLCKNSSR